MSLNRLMRPARRAGAGLCFGALVLPVAPAFAGSGANFVLYNHHTAEQGEKEIKLYSDFANVGSGGADYFAQLIEFEYGVTDRWTTALYFEGDKIDGEDYEFGGWRFENRVRLFEGNVFLNPVLYAEYEELKPAHRYNRAVVGRTDGEEGEEEEEEGTEHELETKLILGQDINDRLDVSFNWINETNFDTGEWAFGYALGFNYVLFEDEGSKGARGWALKEVKMGAELFGGLGDSEEGLTLSASETEQYAGLNLKGEFANGIELGIGGAFGLTDDSENAILRTMIDYEFN
jgi:hypothetical protein